jgi:glycosyltransferase involved in cell wall biosynthesis
MFSDMGETERVRHSAAPGEIIRLLPEGFAKHSGGVRRTSYELLAALRKSELPIEVSPWVDARRFTFEAPTPSVPERLWLQVQATCKSFRRPAGVTHSLYYDPAVRMINGAKVTTVHDMIHEQTGIGVSALRFAKSEAVKRSDVVVAISKATRDEIRVFYGDTPTIRVIPWGVSGSILRVGQQDPRKPRQYLLYVGYRAHHKNFELLVRAYERSPDLKDLPLVIVGGPPLSVSEHSAITSATGRPPQHHRQIDDISLCNLYDGAIVTVIPSKVEGFGLPTLEAMARRCPVACSNIPSLAETAGGHAALFDPSSPEECAMSILTAINRSSAWVDKARIHAAGFTWERTAEAYSRVYSDLMLA